MKAVARIWAEGRGGSQTAAGDPLTQAAEGELALRGQIAVNEIELPVEDEPTVKLFYSLSTQWKVDAWSGRRTGIDYSQIRPTAENLGITMSPDRFLDIQRMEAAALNVFAARR